jgi:hypothetical protein
MSARQAVHYDFGMATFEPNQYGLVFAPLLSGDRRRPLDAGRPAADALGALEKLTVESAFAHARVIDRQMAECCLAGVWLLHDYLDESHKISQNIETTSGSFWHAIMHRRESDFGNAKYWFRRVGQHPVLDHVVEFLRNSNASVGDTRLLADGDFDPFAFVDLCEGAVRGSNSAIDRCMDIQQAEWEALFDYCYREAVRNTRP